ncbi:MAG: CARDB domain-containing protein [Dehalococcoidia bacterium]|nr:CARDB domain-containing protein [Dehalococcoidia bacterium]
MAVLQKPRLHMQDHYLSFARLIMALSILMIIFLTAGPASADWTPDTRLSASNHTNLTNVVVSGNNVHVVWQDDSSLPTQVYYKRSTDGGLTWGADTVLTDSSTDASDPSIAVSGSNVYIAWTENDPISGNSAVYFKRSIDNGLTWSGSPIELSDPGKECYSPTLAASGNNVYAVWHCRSNEQIYYNISVNSGLTWGTEAQLSDSSGVRVLNPSVAASGTNVHVVWQDTRDAFPLWCVYYNHSTDSGLNWGDDTRLSTLTGKHALNTRVAVSGNNVHVVWADLRSDSWVIYYRLSTDGGMSWGSETILSTGCPGIPQPSVAVSGSNVYVVWYDDRAEPSQVYYNYSTNGGQTWAGDAQLSNCTANGVCDPWVAVSVTAVHVVWPDSRTGASDAPAYYKRNTFTIPSFTITASAGANGSISPSGLVTVNNGANQIFIINANNGYRIVNVLVDGVSVGPVSSYTFRNVTANHTISVSFSVSQIGPIGGGSQSPGDSITTPVSPQGPINLSNLQVQSATISNSKVSPGTPVTVTASVANSGTGNGSANIKVYVNGQEEASRGITVNSGSNAPVTFTVVRNEPGTYTVYVGAVSAGNFTVEAAVNNDAILIAACALLATAFIIGLFMLRSRRRLG